MTKYPLFIDYKLIVNCKGYRARVDVKGTILVEHDDKEWWAYGVNPGGICAEGTDFDSAVAAFYDRFCSVLFDVADRGQRFPLFKKEVEDIVRQTNDPYQTMWNAARDEVRAGKIDRKDIPHETRDVPVSISVKKLAAISPRDNDIGGVRVLLASEAA